MQRLIHLCLLTAPLLLLQPGSVWAQSAKPTKKLDLYLLIGQSNMAGRDKVTKEDKKPHPRVFALNKKDEWVPAVDPIHFDKSVAGVGPGTAFGIAMAKVVPSAQIGLIPCAAGGSPITVWKKGATWSQTKSKPYDEMLRRVAIAKKNGTIKGILWHQGESDSNARASALYAKRLEDLIARIRKDLDALDVPFIVGGMSDPLKSRNEQARIVDSALQNLPRNVRNTAYVSAAKLKLKSDNIHFNADACRELGQRYAKALQDIMGK